MKAGTYTIDGAFFPLTEAPRSAFQSGDYMAEITFTKDDQVLIILKFYAMIINISWTEVIEFFAERMKNLKVVFVTFKKFIFI